MYFGLRMDVYVLQYCCECNGHCHIPCVVCVLVHSVRAHDNLSRKVQYTNTCSYDTYM